MADDDTKDRTKRSKHRVIMVPPRDLDRRPHTDPSPEDQAIATEESRIAKEKAREEFREDPDGFKRRRREEIEKVKERQGLETAAYAEVLNRLKDGPADDRNCVVAYLTDGVRMSDQKIAEIFDRSKVWVRVARRRARIMFPCGNSSERLCGGRAGCSHKRALLLLTRIGAEVVKHLAEVNHE